jgi:hypothetical protein
VQSGPTDTKPYLPWSRETLTRAVHVAGWYVDRSSNFSIRAYCREHARRGLPLPYSSDSQSDDLPYWVPSPIKDEPGTGEDEGLLMIPVSQDCSDMRFNVRGAGWAGPDDFFKHLVSHDESRSGDGSGVICLAKHWNALVLVEACWVFAVFAVLAVLALVDVGYTRQRNGAL